MEDTMKLFDHLYKAVNPLKYAIKKGMHVGKGVTLASKSGTSFGSEPYLITLEDEVRISGAATFITHEELGRFATWMIIKKLSHLGQSMLAIEHLSDIRRQLCPE